MNPLPFLMFAVFVIGWCLLHLVVAFRALASMRNGRLLEIDMDYVRIRGYHAREVREGRSPSAKLESPLSASSRTMTQPLLCGSDCLLQESAQVNAVVSGGALTLEKSVSVRQFADSQGEMIVGDGCVIGGEVTSATVIRIGRGVSARSFYAPEVVTADLASARRVAAPENEPMQIPGYNGVRQLSSDTWVFQGDLRSSAPLNVACKLIVAGSLSAGAGSIFADDVKTIGDLILGPDCVCRGALVSDEDIELGAGSQFQRTIYAAGELRLKAGVRGEGSGEVAAFGRISVLLDNDVLIRGRVASDGKVVTA